MNRKHKIKLIWIACLIALLSIAAGLILYALKQNINLFYTPTQLLQSTIQPDQDYRIGGYVKMHSVHYDTTGTRVIFVITDRVHEISVSYQGVLPNLFREGQGIVATGKISPTHLLIASQVLAKHDEKYMPRPLAESLKQGAQR